MPGTRIIALEQPFDALVVLRRKRALRRELIELDVDRTPLRVALLAGSTIDEIREMLELFLLDAGFAPTFYESGYDRAFETALFDSSELDEFRPELVYVHTSLRNLKAYPGVGANLREIGQCLDGEVDRFATLWGRLSARYGCPVIQNNFELPSYRTLGHLDAVDPHGRTRFILEINRRFAERIHATSGLYLHDLHYLSAQFGLDRWHDEPLWCSTKYALAFEAIPHLAHSVTRVVSAIFGRSSKGLVLDLDNTLWGGVIGEDGPQGIRLGQGIPEGEAYATFQSYIRELRDRGVILAVASKNDDATAMEGINHPDSLLTRDAFAAFVANWEPKPANLRQIAQLLELGSDSLVFVDDNPMERDAVRAQAPEITVPEAGTDPLRNLQKLDRNGYFESVGFSRDDLSRSDYYRKNAQRKQHASRFDSYEDFLGSLEMEAEIDRFAPLQLPRITQLINKTNQFNLTTQRMSESDVTTVAGSKNCITLSTRLHDRFGDNGLISALIGTILRTTVHIDSWLMSCRVLRRGVEFAMLDSLVDAARDREITQIEGRYIPTRKNGIVRDLYAQLGFEHHSDEQDGSTIWRLDLTQPYKKKNQWIRIIDGQRKRTKTG